MKTITRNVLLAAMMLATVTAYAQKGGGNDLIKKKIQAYNNQMVQAILSGDEEKSLSFYEANAISLPNYGRMIRGLDEIAKHQRESAEKGNKVTAITLTTKKVTAYGNAVVEIGTFTITMELASMPQPISDEGKYLTVWLKQDNGSYKIINEIWNTNVHPMKAMKEGQKGDVDPNLEQQKKQNDKGSGLRKSDSDKKPSSETKKR